MTRIVLCCLGAFWLAGCASVAPSMVKVAVTETCVDRMPEKPAFPADDLDLEVDIFTKGKVLWADRLARKAYELKLETAIAACVKR